MASVDVAVIGAGAIGAMICYELARQRTEVVVLERGSGWAAGCSRGNAGLICPSHAGPFATRAELGAAISSMFDRAGPLRIKPRPAIVPWLARLAMSTGRTREARTVGVMRELAEQSLSMHRALVEAGLATGFRQDGLLDVYVTRRRFDAAHRTGVGQGALVLGPDEIKAIEPALEGRLAGGVLHSRDAHCDPLAFVQAVGQAALHAGARLIPRTEVLEITTGGSRVEVATTRGLVRAEKVVVAAGSWSRQLASAVGGRLQLQPGKGYAVDVRSPPTERLRRPIILQEARVAVTPFSDRVRFAGMMEFAGLDPGIDKRRVDVLRTVGVRNLPGLGEGVAGNAWAGLRPCTPDGLPFVGWVGAEGKVAVATGHAMLGITLAPVTGRLICDLIDGHINDQLRELSPSR